MRKIIDLWRLLPLCVVFFGGFLLFTPPAAGAEAGRAVLGTGAFLGGYYLLGGAICAEVNDAGAKGLRCAVETSKGPLANLQALQAGQVNLALVQSDWQHHAYAGSEAQFAGGKAFKDMRALMSLSGSPLALLARPESGVKGVDDLAGKRLDIGKTGSARRAIMDDVIAAMGWDLGKFKLASELPEADAVNALCQGQIDVLALAGVTPDKNVGMALKTCPVNLIPLAGAARDKILAQKPYYSAIAIPAGSYPGVKAEIPTLGTRVILLTTARLAEKDAYALVKAAADNLPKIRKLHPSLASMERANLATGGISAPLHEGALRFYREAKLR